MKQIEDTIENKQEFFDQYSGQNIVVLPEGSIQKLCTPHAFRFLDKVTKSKSYLELTSLSMITDENAIEVMEILKTDPQEAGYDCSWQKLRDDLRKDGDLIHIQLKSFYGGELDVYDFLRSKGYALPWMGLSVEELVKRGWIRLKTE